MKLEDHPVNLVYLRRTTMKLEDHPVNLVQQDGIQENIWDRIFVLKRMNSFTLN